MPFSKRADASDRRSRRLAVRLMARGLKKALSSATSRVAALISEFSPPMMPAMATGPEPSQMRKSPGLKRPVLAVEGAEYGLSVCGPHLDAPVADARVVEGVEGLAQLQHDVVRHVDDGVDGPHACLGDPAPHEKRRRDDGDAPDHAQDVPGAGVRVGDRKPDKAVDRADFSSSVKEGSVTCKAVYASPPPSPCPRTDWQSPLFGGTLTSST